MNFKLIIPFLCLLPLINASLAEYLNSVSQFFGYKSTNEDTSKEVYYARQIPYEVSVTDEKFISEAAKLTGVALSELDSCQQKVVLKLQADCSRLNDEQLAKLAVQLLNCQSYVEGRPIYPCTESMTIKECTTAMDSDTWTSYHLMSNRARAVCYSIRQAQFRGLAEQTVNRLMTSSQSQLSMLDKIAEAQENIQSVAENTLETVAKGNEELVVQHEDLRKAQLHGQLTLEDNIRRLVDEKRLISESHRELSELAYDMQTRLHEASKQIQTQAGETKTNHRELLDDLVAIQNKAHVIFQRIDDSSKLLLEQSKLAREQYETTLAQLAEVNATVHNLVAMVGGTKQMLEERLAWVTSALGGTDLAVERLYVIVWHSAFLLLGMIGCAFLAAPVNGSENALDFFGLVSIVIGLVFAHVLFVTSLNAYRSRRIERLTFTKPTPESTTHRNDEREGSYQPPMSTVKESSEDRDEVTDYYNPTPPASRNGHYVKSRSQTPSGFVSLNGSLRGSCSAKTRAGVACKLSATPGREFCYRHQTGSSVMS